ncbi:hypothetical protein N7475_001100 [Penicillium sp. IBT 31633x]|nr:hypothetical protein N7475_001100 [Penicillium sp. IBT 31633x]
MLALRGKQDKSDITVLDVLCWAVSETWVELRRNMPLWAVQVKRYERQRGIWDNTCMDDSLELSESQAESFLELKCQTLQHRYRPGYSEGMALESPEDGNQNLRLIDDRCREFGTLNFASSALQEEQERELAPEIEVERQVQRPPGTTPRAHQLHGDLRSFVATGQLTQQSDAYIPAFRSLSNTSAASFTKVKQFPTELLVTTDFSIAVVRPSKLNEERGAFDTFQ